MKGFLNCAISLGLALIIWLLIDFSQLMGHKAEGIQIDQELQDPFSESCKNSSIDIYLHFFWIFASVYALAKLTELSERFWSAKKTITERSSDMRVINEEWEKTLKLYEQDKRQLDSQLQALREKNYGLEESMRDLRDCNLHLISENFKQTVLQDRQIQGLAQRVEDQQSPNIYITNRHIHLTRQVFLKGDVAMDLGVNLDQPLNVWVQYLRMRKCYMGPIVDPKFVPNGHPEQMLPIVMTTEQLAQLQGMI